GLHGVFIDLGGLLEGQVVQERADVFKVRVVTGNGFGPREEQVIRQRFEDRLGKVRVVIEKVHEIPRTERGKFRAVISNLKAQKLGLEAKMSVSPATKPHVSIIIPCRNEVRDIEACLSSVLAQQEPRQGFEVIVADGMSDDGTRELLRKIETREPRIRVIDNPNRIASTGLNAGIRAARGEVIVRMDAHTEYTPDYIRKCVE